MDPAYRQMPPRDSKGRFIKTPENKRKITIDSSVIIRAVFSKRDSENSGTASDLKMQR